MHGYLMFAGCSHSKHQKYLNVLAY